MSERRPRVARLLTSEQALEVLGEEVPGRVATQLPRLRPLEPTDIAPLSNGRFCVRVVDEANHVDYVLGPFQRSDLGAGLHARLVLRIFADFN